MNKLTGVSLFAGVGGFDLAMERNSVEVLNTFLRDTTHLVEPTDFGSNITTTNE